MGQHYLIIVVLFLVATTLAEDMRYFNVTPGTYTFRTDYHTEIQMQFGTDVQAGQFGVQDIDVDDTVLSYVLPEGKNGYTVFGVSKLDMRGVTTTKDVPFKYSFSHHFSTGIDSVDPKTLCLAVVDPNGKKMTLLEFTTGDFFNTFTTTIQDMLQQSIDGFFSIAILGLDKDLIGTFGKPIQVSYRATIKYSTRPELQQFLRVCINRNLNFPSHEYTTSLLPMDTKYNLPSSDMIVLLRYTFSPILANTFSRWPVSDFIFNFNQSLGFVNGETGKQVDIDVDSLKCLFAMKDSKDYFDKPGASNVIHYTEAWIQLQCGPVLGLNDFYPESFLIVGKKKSPTPVTSPTPIPSPTPVASSLRPKPVTSPKASSSSHVNPITSVSTVNPNHGETSKITPTHSEASVVTVGGWTMLILLVSLLY